MSGSKVKSRMLRAFRVFGQVGLRLRPKLGETALGRILPARLVIRVIQKLGEDDAAQMAASISFYAVLSIFPLILALLSIIGWVAGSQTRQDELVDFIVGYLPGSEQFMRDSLEGAHRLRATASVAAVLGLLWSASAVLGSINRVVNRAWGLPEMLPFFRSKPRQLLMALGVGVLFVATVSLTSFIQWASAIEIGGRTMVDIFGGQLVSFLFRLPAFMISFLIFIAIYKYLPSAKTSWRFIWTGATLAAVLFEASKGTFLWYLEHFARFDQIYGNLASVVILMIWIYICSMILIAGAELSSEYGRIKSGGEPG